MISGIKLDDKNDIFYNGNLVNYSPIIKVRCVTNFAQKKQYRQVLKKQKAISNLNSIVDNQSIDAKCSDEDINRDLLRLIDIQVLNSTSKRTRRKSVPSLTSYRKILDNPSETESKLSSCCIHPVPASCPTSINTRADTISPHSPAINLQSSSLLKDGRSPGSLGGK